MTSASASTDRAPAAAAAADRLTARSLIARYKLASIIASILLILLLVIVVGGILGSRSVTVTDATSCSAWGSASQVQQRAYARRYVSEHGPIPGGARDPASVIAAIDNGCQEAYVNDVEDNVPVVRAVQP